MAEENSSQTESSDVEGAGEETRKSLISRKPVLNDNIKPLLVFFPSVLSKADDVLKINKQRLMSVFFESFVNHREAFLLAGP